MIPKLISFEHFYIRKNRSKFIDERENSPKFTHLQVADRFISYDNILYFDTVSIVLIVINLIVTQSFVCLSINLI